MRFTNKCSFSDFLNLKSDSELEISGSKVFQYLGPFILIEELKIDEYVC